MASYNELNQLIDAYINRNGVQAITGQILNGVLKAMVEQLGRGYTIMGVATPTTDPGTPDGPECYFASTPGTYTDFDGLQIVPGELALLCYTPTDGWTKTTIYEGFQTVQATIDGNVGTPSVGVSYANGVLSFDFHNIKGNPGQNGQDGQDGDPAGFGTIGADIAGGVGTPGVTVESSGPATAKNLQFHFTNLKGETGVTSVVATVDNTTGNPACTVSLVGQQLTLAFSGLKGAQGDTGVSADYPITIVNNLTTNDPASALSAAMGVQLEGEISQLEAKVDAIVEGTSVQSPNLFDKTAALSGYVSKTTGGRNASNNWMTTDFIDISGYEVGTIIDISPFPTYAGSVGVAFYDANQDFTHGRADRTATQSGDKYYRASIPIGAVDTTMVYAGTAPEEYVPYGTITTYSLKDSIVETSKIEDGAVTTQKVEDGAITNDKLASNAVGNGKLQDGSVTDGKISSNAVSTGKIQDDAVTKEKAAFIEKTTHYPKNLLNPSECQLGFIRYSDGEYRDTTTNRYASGFIPVDSNELYTNAFNPYGSTGGWAVYDANKGYIRGGMSWDYSYQAGDAYMRITLDAAGIGTTTYVVKANDTHEYTPYFDPYTSYKLDPSLIKFPTIRPALSAIGEQGYAETINISADTTHNFTNCPQYVKRNFNISAAGKFSAFSEFEIGVGGAVNNSLFVRIDGTNAYLYRHNGSSYHLLKTEAHGLTISSFINVGVVCVDAIVTARIMSAGGGVKITFPEVTSYDIYGIPFVRTSVGTTFTSLDVRISSASMSRPIWVVGDSYVSWYDSRWPYQLANLFGIKNFHLQGLAGAGSATMYADLVKALSFGVPRFLVWCLGMNDTASAWENTYANLVTLCQNNGITLVLQTIPWPTGGNKSVINDDVEDSGLRYFDGYKAVSSDANGTWYTGMNDDGTHPTELGAKALASRFVVDFPEILSID